MLEHPLCPSSTRITRFICMVVIGLLFLAAAILLVGGNGWSQIVAAVVLAQVVGVLIHKATSLPPLLGMLLVGLLMRQLGYVEYFSVQHEAIIYIARWLPVKHRAVGQRTVGRRHRSSGPLCRAHLLP